MRTTINLDDALLDEAQRVTGMKERTAMIHEGLRALIERESARRLTRLGGTEPRLRDVPRRQLKNSDSPSWHGDVLAEREAAVSEGRELPEDWESAKQSIRREFPEDSHKELQRPKD